MNTAQKTNAITEAAVSPSNISITPAAKNIIAQKPNITCTMVMIIFAAVWTFLLFTGIGSVKDIF